MSLFYVFFFFFVFYYLRILILGCWWGWSYMYNPTLDLRYNCIDWCQMICFWICSCCVITIFSMLVLNLCWFFNWYSGAFQCTMVFGTENYVLNCIVSWFFFSWYNNQRWFFKFRSLLHSTIFFLIILFHILLHFASSYDEIRKKS